MTKPNSTTKEKIEKITILDDIYEKLGSKGSSKANFTVSGAVMLADKINEIIERINNEK